LLASVASALLVGCGYTPVATPNLSRAATSTGLRQLGYSLPGYQVKLKVPRNWYTTGGRGSLVAVTTSGHAVIALWHYASSAAPPSTQTQLSAERGTLLAAIRRSDPGFKLLAAVATALDSHPAIAIAGIETVNGYLREVSSEHIYLTGGELVLDEYAPPSSFATIFRQVFDPVRASLTLIPAS
jgi:hypothetical protein